ncbi:MAG TPA: class I SAM-dependent methyltransferase [Myxococcales bacterium]|nr:class I SAM-dependent methyltransferase [Myxococcales bacterium]
MKAGRESPTAIAVCMGRAMAHGRTPLARFSDPTALALLPEKDRKRVERLRGDASQRTLGGRLQRAVIDGQARMVVARTVVIDDAVRAAAAPQLVILGAGLDGRAWRLPELRDATVFEVDHPDSQRQKRARAAALTPVARDVRFVPVDYARDRLDEALAAAGHDPARPTTWLWEGVTMYLSQAEVEATLGVVQARSAPGSRLVVLYLTPSLLIRAIGLVGSLAGEAIRSVFSESQMRALLAHFGFQVTQDRDLDAITRSLLGDANGSWWAKQLRIVSAVRV